MKAAFATVGGVQTRYHTSGNEGPRVLLVHGAGISGASWLKVLDGLGQSFQVVAPDTLGHGLTHPGEDRPGPPHPAMLDHLAQLVDDLGWEHFHIVGSSFGALLGALLYFRMPDRVQSLVVTSSGSFVNSDEELAGSLEAAYANGMAALEDPTFENCRSRMERICYEPAAVSPEMIVMQMTEYAMPWAKQAFERRLLGMLDIEHCRPYRVLERLEEIGVPTLLLWGYNDTRGIYTRAREAARRMPQARLIAFDRCKHHPHLEHPLAFIEVVTAFLQGKSLDAYGDVIST